MNNIEFKFRTRELVGAYRDAASRAIKIIAFRTTEEIIDNITIQNRVDTGAMRASTFAEIGGEVGPTGRDASIQVATAKAKVPGVKSKRAFDFQPADQEPFKPESPLQAKVGVSASYTKYQEDGGRVDGLDEDGNQVGYVREGGKFVASAYDTVKGESNKIMKDELAKVK